MSDFYTQAEVLYRRHRYEDAVKFLLRDLAIEPENGLAYSLMALCHLNRDRPTDALEQARNGIKFAADVAWPHYVLAKVHYDRELYLEAEKANAQAIALDPSNPSYHGLLANIRLARGDWEGGLKAADMGLAVSPTHVHCRNLRAYSLAHLGRYEASKETMESVIKDAPDDALTHTYHGWSFLERHKPKKAIAHFGNALRLDPSLDWARRGMLEALRQEHWFYRYQAFTSRWYVLLALISWFVGSIFLCSFGFAWHADDKGNVIPVMLQYEGACSIVISGLMLFLSGRMYMNLLQTPILNFAFQFDPHARWYLSHKDRLCANIAVVGLPFALAIGAGLAYFKVKFDGQFILMLLVAMLQMTVVICWLSLEAPARKERFREFAGYFVLLSALYVLMYIVKSIIGVENAQILLSVAIVAVSLLLRSGMMVRYFARFDKPKNKSSL